MNRSHRARTLLRLIAATGLLVFLGMAVLLELRPVVILSGSMEPSISTGSICFISGADRRGVPGKVVAYELKDHLVVHRISRCVSGGESFITKGDSNDTEDPIPVSAKQIRGRVIGTIPYLGYGAVFLRSRAGILLTAAMVFFLLKILCSTICTQEGQYIFHWLRYIVEQQSTTTIPKSEW